ncbi:hypothetical protein HHI36_000855 [Cryptolaemus montrouzieri]|uniref:Uncharacterized protein n=1 Tax=Cryptolaemus montrouzieri TaxID=559131 RepID=A0ABD2P6K3_9CUCU
MYRIKHDEKLLEVREVGGSMAPLWHKYFQGIKKLVYVIDASNLCQISAAGVLLYTILADPSLAYIKGAVICVLICLFSTIVRSKPYPQDSEGAATGDGKQLLIFDLID